MAGLQPLVSIFIVAYNSIDCIDRCLAAIPAACQHHPYEILLIDNGIDGTAARVSDRYPEVRVLESHGNIGFAAANNRLAAAASAPHFLLINPDVFVDHGAIDALVAGTVRRPNAAAWGGVTTNAQGEPDTGNAIPLPSLSEFASSAFGRSRAGRTRDDLTVEKQVLVLSGGFVLIARTAWDEVGGFDESFFLYCEEVDLFYRLTQRGHAFWRIPTATAHHAIAHGNSLSPKRSLYRTAGTMHFARKHWPRHHQAMAAVLLWLAACWRFVAGRLLGWTSERLAQLGQGYRLVALKPWYWWSGYEPRNGLMAQLNRRDV
jgi:N-acetylglucosaminyl-diphospho-decaprenol L-rhamnosyltransferase